jgi:hypothetical protein
MTDAYETAFLRQLAAEQEARCLRERQSQLHILRLEERIRTLESQCSRLQSELDRVGSPGNPVGKVQRYQN